MGIIDSIVNDVAYSSAVSKRENDAKMRNQYIRGRAPSEKKAHDIKLEALWSKAQKSAGENKKKFILDHIFAQAMHNSYPGLSDFSAIDDYKEEYKNENKYKFYVANVEYKYYKIIAEAIIEAEMTVSTAIRSISDLLYFEELKDKIEKMTSAKEYFENEAEAGKSILEDVEDCSEFLEEIKKSFDEKDIANSATNFSSFLSLCKQGKYEESLYKILYCGIDKNEINKIKKILLYLALQDESDVFIVKMYEVYSKIAKRLFGYTIVEEIGGEKQIILYDSLDMIIAEVIRMQKVGTLEDYIPKFTKWMNSVGEHAWHEHLKKLHEILFCLKAYKLEKIVLQYILDNNIARTPEQEQRLKELNINNVSIKNLNNARYIYYENDNSNNVIYDRRFLNWRVEDIQKYFENLIIEKKKHETRIVLEEWEKDITFNNKLWKNEVIGELIKKELEENFDNSYKVNITYSIPIMGAIDEEIESIHIYLESQKIRNYEIEFLLTGEKITKTSFHLSLMTLFNPLNDNNEIIQQKVISIKEKYNPRTESYINTVKKIIIEKIENWINENNIVTEIY